MRLVRYTLGFVLDAIAAACGHRIYDRFSIQEEAGHQLFCTCGGRIIVDVGTGKHPWVVVDSTCNVMDLRLVVFDDLRSDYPIAKAFDDKHTLKRRRRTRSKERA